MSAETFKAKPDIASVLDLARCALQHGLVGKCADMLDKAAEIDKANPVVVAYLKVKAELDRPLPKGERPGEIQSKLLVGYKATETDHNHFLLLHDGSTNDL